MQSGGLSSLVTRVLHTEAGRQAYTRKSALFPRAKSQAHLLFASVANFRALGGGGQAKRGGGAESGFEDDFPMRGSAQGRCGRAAGRRASWRGGSRVVR